MRFAVSGEEFFVEEYVTFGIDASCRLIVGSSDGTVDGFVVEVFIYIATVAGDSSFRGPAVNIAAKRVGGVREDVHGWDEMHSEGERSGPVYGWM